MKTHSAQAMVKTYLAVFGALAILTVLTVTVSYLHLARVPAVSLAVLIALVKASLITAFFMHLKFEGRLIWSIFLVALAMFIILLVPVLFDIGCAHACAVCFGFDAGQKAFTRGYFWGILLLLLLPVGLILTIGGRIFFAIRKQARSQHLSQPSH